MMQVLRKMDTVIARKLSRKGRVIEQILRSTVRGKTAVEVQKTVANGD